MCFSSFAFSSFPACFSGTDFLARIQAGIVQLASVAGPEFFSTFPRKLQVFPPFNHQVHQVKKDTKERGAELKIILLLYTISSVSMNKSDVHNDEAREKKTLFDILKFLYTV